MARYGYTRIAWDSSYRKWILLNSTDLQIVDWFLNEVKKRVPACKYTAQKLSPGKPYSVTIEKLKPSAEGDAQAIAYWATGQLGQEGWEPFAAGGGVIDLRKKYE